MSTVKQQILPLAESFIPLTAGTGYKLKHVELPEGAAAKEEEEEELSLPDKVSLWLEDPAHLTLAIMAALASGGLGLAVLGFIFYKRKGKLLDTPSDYRLASRYGAGVSRHVRYLEGQEAAKAKTIF